MKDIINKILYLTHDKWEDKTKIKYRNEFEEYLKLFLEYNPEIEQELEIMLEYSNTKENLLTYKGVMEILKNKDKETDTQVCLRVFSKNKKDINNIG